MNAYRFINRVAIWLRACVLGEYLRPAPGPQSPPLTMPSVDIFTVDIFTIICILESIELQIIISVSLLSSLYNSYYNN